MALTKAKLVELIQSGALDAYLGGGGSVGTEANKPIITGTGGVLQAGEFGTGAGEFCQGNDTRLSDARTPTAHDHDGDYSPLVHGHSADYLPKDDLVMTLTTGGDADTVTKAWILLSSNSSNLPTAHYYYVQTARYSSSKIQLAYGYNTSGVYYRRYYSSAWTAWTAM